MLLLGGLAGSLAACGAPGPVDANGGGTQPPAAPATGVHPAVAEAVAQLYSDEQLARILRMSPVPAVPPDPTNAWADDEAAAHLGQYLFYEERLSANGAVSCANCHDPALGWSDGLPFGVGVDEVDRHSMTLWNVAYNRWFFWDGRADSLWSQALLPLEDPREHAGSRLQFAHVVHGDPDLRGAYEACFGSLPELEDRARFPAEGRPVAGEPEHPHQVAWETMAPADRSAVTRVFVNLGKAIAAYERKILTTHSRFDEFVEGLRTGDSTKMRSLDTGARRGLALFVGKGNCHLCHQGPNLTDREFHNTRVPAHAEGDPYDPGRYDGLPAVQEQPFRGTSEWSDDPQFARTKLDYLVQTGHTFGEFKTPSLRNVTLTAPYMHQGQFETLREVLHHYSTLENALPVHQHAETILVPVGFTEQEISDVEAFLSALTDEALDPALTRKPSSPYGP